jgi:hypothetical protein
MLQTILLGVGGWLGLFTTVNYAYNYGYQFTYRDIIVIAVLPVLIPSLLLLAVFLTKNYVILGHLITIAMFDPTLFPLYMSLFLLLGIVYTGLVTVTKTIQYAEEAHRVPIANNDEVENEDEEAEDAEEEAEEEEEEDEAEEEEEEEEAEDAPPATIDNATGVDTGIDADTEEGTPVVAAFTELQEPTPKLLRIKTPTEPLTDLTPGSDATPAAPIVQIDLQALVDTPEADVPETSVAASLMPLVIPIATMTEPEPQLPLFQTTTNEKKAPPPGSHPRMPPPPPPPQSLVRQNAVLPPPPEENEVI